MNKRTISGLDFSRIPARFLMLMKAVATGTVPGKMAAVLCLLTLDAPPSGNSSALPFHPRDMSRNKTLIKGG
jgi:hypothetical protein